MAEKKKYNSILVSGRKDETLTYSRYVKDEESGESVKESLDKKVNITDELTTQQIKDGAITNKKMAADSVGNTNLQDGSVSNEKLEDGSITNEKLAENSITKDKLKDNTIGVEKLDPELRQTINAATGLPENLVETIQNVDDTLKDHQIQLNDKQSQIDDKQQQITANDEDISLLQTRSTQMEETIKSISVTGGASQATAVTYDNTTSQLTSVNIQGAVDELQGSKIDKISILQESGDAEDKVMSQKAVSAKLNDLSNVSKIFFSKHIANKKYLREIFIEGNAPDLYLTHFGIWNDMKYLNISDVNGESYATVFSKDADNYIVKEKNGVKIHILVDWNFASSTINPELGDPTDDTKIKNANSLYTPCIQAIINDNNIKQNKHDITNIDNIINVSGTASVELKHVFLAPGKYMVKSGKIVEYHSLSLAYYKVEKGAELTVDIPEQCNSAGYLIGYADIADGISDVIVDEGIGKGDDTQEHKNLNFTALYTKYLVVGYRTGSSVPSVTSSSIKKSLTDRVSEIERKIGKVSILSNKSIMLFGDSLSAASTDNVTGFAKNIASYLDITYRAFLYDSVDGNTDDVDVDYPCLTNYAKDGTTNSTRDSRTDSVVERVKRHISNSTNVDYILIECCINDCSTSTKGDISESYTDSFDISTTIGSIEETIRYITTLSKNIKLGFFIPWNISYIAPEWFDNYKQVFEKWSIPLLDLRKCAGFNFRNCVEHRKYYSLNSNSVDEWSNEKTYMLDEQVKYGGILYKCNKDNVVGILPTDSATWTKMISGNYDGTHLNSLGHSIVTGKILSFIESL